MKTKYTKKIQLNYMFESGFILKIYLYFKSSLKKWLKESVMLPDSEKKTCGIAGQLDTTRNFCCDQ